jgi:hypothetical protein
MRNSGNKRREDIRHSNGTGESKGNKMENQIIIQTYIFKESLLRKNRMIRAKKQKIN